MAIDTSAIIAVLFDEPPASRLATVMAGLPPHRLSAASLVEASVVMQARFGDPGELRVDALLQRSSVEVMDVTLTHADIARHAFRRFGRGRHPARLNFGDCFSYALATALREPLLFVGDDFSQTDVAIAPY